MYEDPSSKKLDLREIAGYLRKTFGRISVDVREQLTVGLALDEAEGFARKFASAKVRDLTSQDAYFEPLQGEVEFERKLLLDPTRRLVGVLYDGFRLQEVFHELIPRSESSAQHAHIVFTSRLFGTFDRGDRRYHARVSVYGFPSLISTSGIVEAPAKPKEFYALKHQYLALGATARLEELKRRFRGKFIDYDDERLTEVMKGYAVQAIFHNLMLDPFCEDRRCRLHNSHWQEELIEAQLTEPEFCGEHERILLQLRGSTQGPRGNP